PIRGSCGEILECNTRLTKPEPVLPNSSLSFCSPERPYCPSACASCAVPKDAFVVVFAHYSLTLCCWPPFLRHARGRGGRGLRRTQPQCYRNIGHARLSRGKTITLKCLRPRSKPFIAPMTMHNPPVIMHMYCEAFVV